MVLRDEEQPTIQLAVHPDQSFTLQSKMMPGQSWTANCSGRIGRYTGGTTHFPSDQIAAIRARCSQHFSRDYCYGVLTAMGFTYGPEYQGIAEVWQGDGESLARIECPQALLDAGDDGHVVHPALLDACFQVVVFGTDIWRGARGRADTIMPVEVDRFRHSGRALGPEVWCHLTLEKPTSTSVRGHFLIANSDGTVVIEIRGFKGQRVVNLRHAAEGDLARSLHELEWHARSLPGHRAVADVAVLPDLAPDVARVFPAGGGDPHQRATHYDEVEPHFTALCGAYAWEAFRGLGWSPRDGERVDLAALPAALGVAESRRPLARLLLEFIVDDGLIARDGDRWVVGRTSGVADSAVLRRTLHERYPKYEGVLGVLDRAGATLHDLLRGADAADEAHVIGAAVAASPFRAAAVAGVRQLLAGIATRLPAGRPIRVLEIGAGAACATSAILSALPRHRTEYLCTDPTSAGLAAARAALQDAAFVEFRQVDLAASEGPHALSATDVDVDVVIALDTLTPGDAERRLRRAADALAPGGVCIAVARARPQRALDVLHHVGSPGPEGDGVRPDGWQSADAWKACLVNSGLAAPIVVSDDGPGGDSAGCVMVARSADRPAPAVEGPSAEGTWVVFGDAGGQARTLAADIAALGGTVFRVETSVAAGPAGPDRWQIRRGHPEDLDAFLSVHAALLGVARGVVHLGMLDAQETPDDASLVLTSDTAELRSILMVCSFVGSSPCMT